jgi:hypothetical protein
MARDNDVNSPDSKHRRGENRSVTDPTDSDSPLNHHEGNSQAGVRRVEAVSLTWTKSGLIAAYIGYGAFSCFFYLMIDWHLVCRFFILLTTDMLTGVVYAGYS